MKIPCSICGTDRYKQGTFYLCPKCDAHTDCAICKKRDTRQRRARRRRKEQ